MSDRMYAVVRGTNTPGDVEMTADGSIHISVADEVGMDQLANAKLTESAAFDYEDVAAGTSAQVLGATGAVGDYIKRLVCVVTTALTAQVSLTDGTGSAVVMFPNSPGGGVGTYTIDIGARSLTGGWKVTTGAGVAVRAVGRFT